MRRVELARCEIATVAIWPFTRLIQGIDNPAKLKSMQHGCNGFLKSLSIALGDHLLKMTGSGSSGFDVPGTRCSIQMLG